MQIPTKEGEYNLNFNGHDVFVKIQDKYSRPTTLELIGNKNLNRDSLVKSTYFEVKTENDYHNFYDKSDYMSYMQKLIASSYGNTADPEKIFSQARRDVHKYGNNILIKSEKISKVNDKEVKMTFYVDNFRVNEDELYQCLQGLGYEVKPLKPKTIRASSCIGFTLIKKLNDNNENNLNENIMKNKIRLTEGQLRNVIKESVYRVLNEGTSDEKTIRKWDELVSTVGANTMLNCIFDWCSSDQIEQFIEWFEDEGYIEPDDDEEDYEEEDY